MPPQIPEPYKPSHRTYPACKGMKEPGSSRWDVTPAEANASNRHITRAKPGLGRHTLTISQRGEALGERPPTPTKAVVEIKEEPVEASSSASPTDEQALVVVKRELLNDTTGFRPKLRPFARDEAKQQRYEQYLVLRRNRRAG